MWAKQVSISMLMDLAKRMVSLKAGSCRARESFALVVFESVNVTKPEGQGSGAQRKNPEGTNYGDDLLVQRVQKWHFTWLCSWNSSSCFLWSFVLAPVFRDLVTCAAACLQ